MVLAIVNTLFSPLLQYDPTIVIFGIAFFISGISSILNKKVMSTPKAKELKEKMKEVNKLRQEIMQAQKSGDQKKAEGLTKKGWEIQSKYLSEHTRLMLRPMLVSFLLVLLILPVLSATYGSQIVATVPEIIPFVGGKGLSWLWWYIISSLSLSVIVRKILGD